MRGFRTTISGMITVSLEVMRIVNVFVFTARFECV